MLPSDFKLSVDVPVCVLLLGRTSFLRVSFNKENSDKTCLGAFVGRNYQLIKYILKPVQNSYMFRHRGAIIRELFRTKL
jgi:hypothetical protein